MATDLAMTPASKSAPLEERAAPGVDPFLLEVADVVNTTLDLDTLLKRVAELVRQVIDYQIFAILLLNERTHELRFRFSVGHSPEAQKLRPKLGQGVVGQAAEKREAVLVDEVSAFPGYINAHPEVRSELAIPLIIKNRVIGVLDLQATAPAYFKPEHARLLALVASRIAIGIENARLYTRVVRQAQSLEVLNEISREVTSILNLDRLLERVGELLRRLIDYQMFSILLLDSAGEKLIHRFSLRFNESVHLKHDIPVERGLVGYAAQHKQAVLVPDVSKDPRYIQLNPETRSELCVPLVYKDKVIGVLDLEHTRRGFFTEDHLRTLSTLAAQLAIAIENARLYERIAKEEQRMERDLAMAREVQQRLLPACCPTLGNAELAAKFVPASTIGGDLYDFLPYSQGRAAIAIGDVSGKGAPAALYAALVSGIVRLTAAREPFPAQMLAAVNSAVAGRGLESQFVSMIYAVWDDARRVLHLANSGLPRPIFCHNGELHMIDITGLPGGMFKDSTYDEQQIMALPGDLVVFFSDGMIDAVNRKGDPFGRGGVEKIVAKAWRGSADDVVTAIFQAVDKHAAGTRPFDDQTVVALKIRENGLETSRRKKS
ncbi:MAG TPA: GAF domain-containing protein [Terriglobales bacterium]|jgi:sigma-B regulation protein RsbU (phosphoserine phosphatase)|nr:GAF domain-containing protein [Terriglobales bacterium]